MNKIVRIVSFLFIICLFCLVGCKKHTHSWNDATCLSPRTCSSCGETVGTLGNHSFEKNSCVEPSTCIHCGFTKDDVSEHREEIIEEDCLCGDEYLKQVVCKKCKIVLSEEYLVKEHDYYYEVIEQWSCTEDGRRIVKCHDCDYEEEEYIVRLGHSYSYVIDEEATDEMYGRRHKECSKCGDCGPLVAYVNNGFSTHGKLSVKGPDLVDKNGDKFQLIGLSTHGLQWFPNVVNYETFEELRNTFGINVIRLALYTSEGGYCVANESKKQHLYDLVAKGIEICTELDMYVIIDWHMLGAEDVRDQNPLFYKKEALEFFRKITTQFADNENLLFDIMNEPQGATTWSDCKKYANEVIPAIREKSDGIILVGNPHWTSDLNSVMASPLTGFENIMYSYHFYAGDGSNASKVKYAYGKGFPIFISEHGGMNSDGDGEIATQFINKWYQDLDELNISYVAWNISNSKGSASIFKHGTLDYGDVSSSNLKAWGNFYRNHVRERLCLPTYKD